MSAVLLAALLLQAADRPPSALIEDLRADTPAIRSAAERELARRGLAVLPEILRVLAGEWPDLPGRVDELVRQLSRKDWRDRDAAMKALAALGSRAVDRIAHHETTEDPEVRWRLRTAKAEIEERRDVEAAADRRRDAALCTLLGEIGDASCLAPLQAQLDATPSSAVRLAAVEALGRRRDLMTEAQAAAATEGALRALSVSEETTERFLLVRTIGQLRSPAAIRPLQGLVEDPAEKNVHLKRNSMWALSKIGTPEAIAAIVRSLELGDPYLREGAAHVLEPIAGNRFGFDARADAAANADALKRFREWWSTKHGKPWEE